MTFLTDERAASTTVTHALAIGISSLLVLTLLFGLGSFLDGQEKNAADRQFRTIGERVATEVSKADRYARDNGDSATLRVTHPGRVAGSTYRIAVEDATQPDCATDSVCVVVNPDDGAGATRRVTLELGPTTTVDGGRQVVSGGDFEITVEATGGTYVVRLDG